MSEHVGDIHADGDEAMKRRCRTTDRRTGEMGRIRRKMDAHERVIRNSLSVSMRNLFQAVAIFPGVTLCTEKYQAAYQEDRKHCLTRPSVARLAAVI